MEKCTRTFCGYSQCWTESKTFKGAGALLSAYSVDNPNKSLVNRTIQTTFVGLTFCGIYEGLLHLVHHKERTKAKQHRIKQIRTIYNSSQEDLMKILPKPIVALIVEYQKRPEVMFNTVKSKYRQLPEELIKAIHLTIEDHFNTKK